jgi:hypothetical protein
LDHCEADCGPFGGAKPASGFGTQSHGSKRAKNNRGDKSRRDPARKGAFY